MIYPYVKTALKNKIKMIIHYLQEMGKVTLKPGILWGGKKTGHENDSQAVYGLQQMDFNKK